MKLCIDTANTGLIRKIYETYPVDGVSTNPSILAKEKRDPYEVLHEIRDIIKDDELFVQVISDNAETMREEAHHIISELGEKTLIKIPCIPEGYRAMKLLKEDKIRFIGTAVYTSMQGFLAAKAGAEYIAPYVNRIDNLGYDGIETAKEIHDMIVSNHLDSGLLAASFKNTRQVKELIRYGVKAVTLSPDLFETMVKNASVEDAVEVFRKDFKTLNRPGNTMK